MITIKKKLTTVQLVAPTPPAVDYTVLEDLGIIEKPATPQSFSLGERVRVVLPPYPWTVIWQLGDLGTVLKTWSATKEFEKMGKGYGVVAVKMDLPRKEEWGTIYFFEKDLEIVL